MKKLKLAVDDLVVATFETVALKEWKGTVDANEEEMITGTYPTCTTCKPTIVGTCCTPID
ncbi:MAG TPA: hypothetical protein VFX98_04460 [Longimicrobiaceae bacterium]|nr:hypothetical protein [Longimicrobiaceae bacterium]